MNMLHCLVIAAMLYILCQFGKWVVRGVERWIDEKSKGLR